MTRFDELMNIYEVRVKDEDNLEDVPTPIMSKHEQTFGAHQIINKSSTLGKISDTP